MRSVSAAGPASLVVEEEPAHVGQGIRPALCRGAGGFANGIAARGDAKAGVEQLAGLRFEIAVEAPDPSDRGQVQAVAALDRCRRVVRGDPRDGPGLPIAHQTDGAVDVE